MQWPFSNAGADEKCGLMVITVILSINIVVNQSFL
jgi:hypothetical protein